MNKVEIFKEELKKLFISRSKEIYNKIIDYTMASELYDEGYEFMTYDDFKKILPKMVENVGIVTYILNNDRDGVFDDIIFDPDKEDLVDEIVNIDQFDYIIKFNGSLFGLLEDENSIIELELKQIRKIVEELYLEPVP